MQCPRLDHFVRFNPGGTVSRCGHMIAPPQFRSLDELDQSDWLGNIRKQEWPAECLRCYDTERVNGKSIRHNAIEFDAKQTNKNYLIVGGILDNVCNSACFTCSKEYSTKIGSLTDKIYPIVDNSEAYWNLPLERVVHLDINGGEPSASKNYKRILQNLPPNLESLRLNTNCSLVIEELEDIVAKGIKVTVTVSLDGIEAVHDYVRWPIKWDKFYSNLMIYKQMNVKLNTWTTVSALNIKDFKNILKFVSKNELNHSYAFLNDPDVLNVKYWNRYTSACKGQFNRVATDRNNDLELDVFLEEQNRIRGIGESLR
jgi:sulfatase maturation enzyme AslB (radical SAM superfamily)